MLWFSQATAEVVDGGFEQGPRGWKTVQTAPSNGEVPFCAIDLNLPAPPGASEGRRHLAVLGDALSGPSPGCNPSFIFQDFVCDSDPSAGGFCTVAFDAALWLAPGEQAAVMLRTDRTTSVWKIPSATGRRSGRHTISAQGCTKSKSKSRLVFVIWTESESGSGTRSIMWIDNVDSYCTAADNSSPDMVTQPVAQVPVDIGSMAGHILRTGRSSGDCNVNGIPDTYELSQGLAADDDGDGILDECINGGYGINWVVLCMGVLILGVTILRLVRKNRMRIE